MTEEQQQQQEKRTNLHLFLTHMPKIKILVFTNREIHLQADNYEFGRQTKKTRIALHCIGHY